MDIKIDTDFIKLDSFLKYVNIASSGGEAKFLIMEGLVKVNGDIALERGKKLRTGDQVEFDGNLWRIL